MPTESPAGADAPVPPEPVPPPDLKADRSVALVVLQGFLPEDETDALQEVVTRMCARLNTLMGTEDPSAGRGPHYQSYRNEQLMVDAPLVGERKREYAKSTYWEILKQKREEYDTPYVIGVCGHPLQESSFNFESRADGVAVVSAAGYAQYRPAGLTRERYLMYLVTCVTVLLENPLVKEHTEPKACLFDVCVLPEQITKGLRKPSLRHCCDKDKGQIRRFPNEYLAPFESVLADIRRRDPLAVMNSSIGVRTTAFLAGILSGFITHLLVAQSARAAVSAVWLVSVGVAAFFIMRAAEGFGMVQRHRGWAFWSVATVSAAVALGGVVLGAVHEWPHLHSEGAATMICSPINGTSTNAGAVPLRCVTK